jgi:superfamily II DNA/RNA helicase
LILAPSKELASQIYNVIHAICQLEQTRGIKIVLAAGGSRKGKQANSMEKGVDIVVGTPGRIMQLNTEGKFNLSHTKYLVINLIYNLN